MQNKELALQNQDLITLSLKTGNAYIDDGRQTWNALAEQIKEQSDVIIALRGAGSVNGADKVEADLLFQKELVPRLQSLLDSGKKVTIIYDGDPVCIEKPDIGYFAGRLLEKFGNNQQGISFVAVQKRSWYYPTREGANLENATGQKFVTYIFENDTYDGDHNAFSQDEQLVKAQGYEQWYIGASGDIATAQLQDFNAKVSDLQKRKATFFRVKNNHDLDVVIGQKLQQAEQQGDKTKAIKLRKQLEQREHIYGSHWDNEGKPVLKADELPNLSLEFVIL